MEGSVRIPLTNDPNLRTAVCEALLHFCKTNIFVAAPSLVRKVRRKTAVGYFAAFDL